MIHLRELASCLHPARSADRRHFLIFQFCCDESHDAPKRGVEPKSYVVAGFFGNQTSWDKVERSWDWKNKRVGVSRYHASHLNAHDGEFTGWSKTRCLRYSKDLLKILKKQQRKLHGISCGIHVDEYRRIISASGQVKMGHPYLVCFKSLIATVAEQMDYGKFPREDKFAVILDQNKDELDGKKLEMWATEIFYGMKNNPRFKYGHRLATCVPGSSEEFACLQPADFIAYESYRLMHDKRKGVTEIRAALNTMLETTGFLGYLFNEEVFNRIKDDVDKDTSQPNGFVIVPQYLTPEKVKEHDGI